MNKNKVRIILCLKSGRTVNKLGSCTWCSFKGAIHLLYLHVIALLWQVYETSGFGGEMICEINSSIPDSSVTSQSVQLENLDFSSDHRVNHGHEGVGSGTYVLKCSNSEVFVLSIQPCLGKIKVTETIMLFLFWPQVDS